MRRLTIAFTLALTILSISLVALPLALATSNEYSGSRRTIKVIPVGGVETGDPIVTTNPADITIFHTGQGPIKNVWLIIVLNKPTYDALDKITINGTTFMIKADFALVTANKIPPSGAIPAKSYPGSSVRYEVSAVKDKMDEKGNPVYYGYKLFLNEITRNPTYFTLKLELIASITDLKALILAIGKYTPNRSAFNTYCACPEPLDVGSSFSKSTLVVPEPATMAMAAAPLAALGMLAVFKKRKMP